MLKTFISTVDYEIRSRASSVLSGITDPVDSSLSNFRLKGKHEQKVTNNNNNNTIDLIILGNPHTVVKTNAEAQMACGQQRNWQQCLLH